MKLQRSDPAATVYHIFIDAIAKLGKTHNFSNQFIDNLLSNSQYVSVGLYL